MTNKNYDEIHQVIQDALFQLQQLVSKNQLQQPDLLSAIKTFLVGMISTTVNFMEANHPGSKPLLYADLETAMKESGQPEVTKVSPPYDNNHYSAANIGENDATAGINYINQQLSNILFKSLLELPTPLQHQEIMLRSIEMLLTDILNQKFNNQAHQALDQLCGHVHMALIDLETRVKH